MLLGETAAERARETGASERTLHHKADQFDQQGMASLFHKDSTPSPDKARALPPDMRQLIVDLKAEHPGFRPHEIATICFLRFGRKPSDHTVQRVLADGPKPSITMRRYLPYAQIADPYQRRRAIVDLHAEGWSITTISAYLRTPRHRVYEVLLFATRYTRYLDKHGFLRFQNWKLYGERGLGREPVTVWVYEGSLKIEYKTVTLSKYSVELQEDRKHLRQVSNLRLADTPFRSPQLTLIDVGPHEWVLYWRVPPYAPARSTRRIQGMVQLPLFDLPPQEKVVGGNEANAVTHPPPFLHLVPQSSDEPDPLNLE